MKFKFYDIISALIPGFIIYILYLEINKTAFDKNYIIPAIAIAFVIGYFINTFSSWLEDIYFFSWGGKPSNQLIDGNGIWKVKFYQYEKVKGLLVNELNSESPKNDELFQVAMRYATPEVNSRVQDFNANYAFSRVILTTILIVGGFVIIDNPKSISSYIYTIPIILVAWYRCKQRAYYYAREVLSTYLKEKS